MHLIPPLPLRFVTLKLRPPLQIFVQDNFANERLHSFVQPTLAEELGREVTKPGHAWLIIVLLTAD